MPITVRIEGSDGLALKLRALGTALSGRTAERAVVAGALIIQNEAKRRAPFRTGTLRRSIHIGGHTDKATDYQVPADVPELPGPDVSAHDVQVYVGTNLDYGRRIEYGFNQADSLGRVYNQAAQPYLRPAIDENGDRVRQEIADALADLIEAAVR